MAGVIMMVAPGPGLVVIAAGFALLARKYVWARNALNKAKADMAAAKKKERGRAARWFAGAIATLQLILGDLYSLQLSWYFKRGTPDEDNTAPYPFAAGDWTHPVAFLGGIAWYMIAFTVPLAFLFAVAGIVILTRQRTHLSAVHTWVLATGTVICAIILAVGLTPFGRDVWAWWLD